MILPFKACFRKPILQGEKIHTLREDVHDRWHTGRKIHFACNVRTSRYSCFKEGVCTCVQDVFMSYYSYRLEVSIDNKYCYDVEQLVRNDGFDTIADFVAWLFPDGNETWSGKIIHWTDFKY